MKNTHYTMLPCDVYIHLSDIPALDSGKEVKAYKVVSDITQYELCNKNYFNAAIQQDENTYLVTLIMN